VWHGYPIRYPVFFEALVKSAFDQVHVASTASEPNLAKPRFRELHYGHVITENWQMSVLMFGALVAAALAAIIIPVGLRYGSPAMLKNLSLIKTCLLVLAAACSGLLSLMCLAAAAWGMNTRSPWGLGILMYLIPTLSLPAFIVLKFGSVRTLSSVLWLMALASSLAFYFGDQADRLASGLRPITNPTERIGMFANAFTEVLVLYSSSCSSSVYLCFSRKAIA
jgi:hypothetical protein